MSIAMQRLAGAIAIMTSTSMAACTAGPAIDVGADWKQAIRNYGLLPLYPMQEDVKIGDVFLYIQPTASELSEVSSERRNNDSSWLIRVDGLDKAMLIGTASSPGPLQSVYASRLRMQPEVQSVAPSDIAPPTANAQTPAPKPAAAKNVPTPAPVVTASQTPTVQATPSPAPVQKASAPQQPKSGSAGQAAQAPTFDVYDPSAVDKNGQPQPVRLQRIALPGLQVARVTNGQLTAAAPIQSFLAKIGLSAADATGYDLTLSSVEEIHLPIAPAYKLLQQNVASFLGNKLPPETLLFWIHQRNPALLKPLCETHFDDPELSRSVLLIANEVVYAHAVDYSFASTSTFAGQIAASLASAPTQSAGAPGAPTPPATVGAPAGAGSPAATGETSPITATQTALSAAIKSLDDAASKQSGPGGSASFGIGRTGNLTLTQKFDMPMAIGMGSFIEYSLSELMEQYQWIYLGIETPNRVLPSGPGLVTLGEFRTGTDAVINHYCWPSSALLAYLKGGTPVAGPRSAGYAAGTSLN